MTIREAHIDFDIKFQEISSAKFNKFSTYEKDWILNRQQLLYIKNKVDQIKSQTGGINDSTRRLEEINSIIKTVDLPVLYDNLDRFYSLLPSDFFMDISEELYYYSCANEYTSETLFFKKYICIFDLNPTKFGNVNNNFEIELTDLTAPDEVVFDFSDFYSTNINQEYIIYLRHLLFEELKTTNSNYTFSLYWEVFENFYEKNKFILVADIEDITGNLPESLRLKYNGSTDTFLFESYTYKKRNIVPNETVQTLTTINKDCSIVSNEIVHRIQKNPYARSNKNSPKLYIEGNKILIQPFKSQIEFQKLRLTYAQFPIFMNYQINRNSRLGVVRNNQLYMDKLVSEAVTYASGLKSKPNFSNLLNSDIKND